eukprot:9852648-Alexandrium_andersonii.AAC.1
MPARACTLAARTRSCSWRDHNASRNRYDPAPAHARGTVDIACCTHGGGSASFVGMVNARCPMYQIYLI